MWPWHRHQHRRRSALGARSDSGRYVVRFHPAGVPCGWPEIAACPLWLEQTAALDPTMPATPPIPEALTQPHRLEQTAGLEVTCTRVEVLSEELKASMTATPSVCPPFG